MRSSEWTRRTTACARPAGSRSPRCGSGQCPSRDIVATASGIANAKRRPTIVARLMKKIGKSSDRSPQKMRSISNRYGGKGMKQMFSLLIAVVIATMMASVSFAQVGAETSRVNGVAVNGNTTTVFEAANESDLQMHLLTQWSGFAERH